MDLTKRRFMQSAAAAAALGAVARGEAQTPMPDAAATAGAAGAVPVTLNINGRPYRLELEPRVTLLDALREYAGLSGTKKGCEGGRRGMNGFTYIRVTDVEAALREAQRGARYLGGGTNLLDLMKGGVEHAGRLVDVSRLPLAEIAQTPEGGLRIGATASNADVA